MIIDAQNLLSSAQALEASTFVSTNVIDLSAARKMLPGVGVGEPLIIVASIVTAAAGASATLAVALQQDDNSGFSSATEIIRTPAIGVASLIVGYRFVPLILATNERYARLQYVVAGGSGFTAGAITAYIAPLALLQHGWER